MKKTITAVICASMAMILTLSLIIAGRAVHTTVDEGYKLIRIHIRANSNESADQQVKLCVRDSLNAIITEKLSGVDSFDIAYARLGNMIGELKTAADEVLQANGFDYESRVRLNNEFFPTRTYEGIVVESGYYDALIVELGSGEGDNWWCVVYPPLCYVTAEGKSRVEYRSLIKELWEKFIDTFRSGDED